MPSSSVPVLNRCVPQPVKELVFSVLNSWDTVEQVLGDLYATWREILGLTVVAFGKFILLVLPVCMWYLLHQICRIWHLLRNNLPLHKLTGKVQLLPKTVAP